MIRQLKAELLKIRSTRTTLGLLLGMVALSCCSRCSRVCSPSRTTSPPRRTSATC